MANLSKNEKRKIVYALLSETNLTSKQKRQYRDWNPDKVSKEIIGLEKSKSIKTKDGYRINEILQTLQKAITPNKTRRGFDYRPVSESRKMYTDRYTYIIEYQTGDKKNRKTEYITITDNVKLTKGEVLQRTREFFGDDVKGKYSSAKAILGSIKITDAYINEKVPEQAKDDSDDLSDYY